MSAAQDFAASVGARCVEPSVPVTSKAFEYRSAAHTDVRITFERARAQIKAQPKIRRAK